MFTTLIRIQHAIGNEGKDMNTKRDHNENDKDDELPLLQCLWGSSDPAKGHCRENHEEHKEDHCYE